MPGTDDDLEARVTALEAQVRLVRADAAAARVLAGGADRDVSVFAAKLDAHTRTLTALRETQLEQGLALDGLGNRVDHLGNRVDHLGNRVDDLGNRLGSLEREMRGGFAMTATGMARITTLLENIGSSPPDQHGHGGAADPSR